MCHEGVADSRNLRDNFPQPGIRGHQPSFRLGSQRGNPKTCVRGSFELVNVVRKIPKCILEAILKQFQQNQPFWICARPPHPKIPKDLIWTEGHLRRAADGALRCTASRLCLARRPLWTQGTEKQKRSRDSLGGAGLCLAF